MSDEYQSIIAEIKQWNRMRTDLVNSITSITNQIKSIERRVNEASEEQPVPASYDALGEFDGLDTDHQPCAPEGQTLPVGVVSDEAELVASLVTLPLTEAKAGLIKQRNKLENHLKKLAKKLPVYPWIKEQRGAGDVNFAQIIGEAGDLSNYSNPGKLWKRFGLHVVNGKAPKPKSGEKLEYSPRRRSIAHILGDCLVKLNQDGPYRTLYDERKQYELLKNPDGKPIEHHKRAMRYMEKRFLKHLWQQWRDCSPEKGRDLSRPGCNLPKGQRSSAEIDHDTPTGLVEAA